MLSFIIRPILSNRLKKESNALKAEYDNLKDELYLYGERLTRENTRNVNDLIGNLNSKLVSDQEFLYDISQPLKEFIRLSFDINIFYKQIKLAYARKNELSGRQQFLNSDIQQTKLEIEELKNSRAKLLSASDMHFYIELLKYNKCINTNKNIMEEIKELIKNKNTLPDEKRALLRLENLIREKMSIREDIKKVDWLIEQKIKKIEINISEIMKCSEIKNFIYDFIGILHKKIDEVEEKKRNIFELIKKRIYNKSQKLIPSYLILNEVKLQLNRIYGIDENDRSDDEWDKIKTLMFKKTSLINSINILYQEQIQYRWQVLHETLQQYGLRFSVKRKEIPDRQGANNEG